MSQVLRHPRQLLVMALALVTVLALASSASAAKRHGHPGHHGYPSSYGATALALDPAAADALKSLGVQAAPIAPATAEADGLNFPIVNSLGDALERGRIRHRGGISLTAGTTTVELRNFTIVLDENPDLTARVGDARVSILDLDLSTAKVGFAKGVITFGPVAATLTQAAADALNAAFKVDAFKKGLKLGDATVKYRVGRYGH